MFSLVLLSLTSFFLLLLLLRFFIDAKHLLFRDFYILKYGKCKWLKKTEKKIYFSLESITIITTIAKTSLRLLRRVEKR